MKKRKKSRPDMLPEYDFSKGVRGKYAERFAAGTNLILLSADLVPYFPDSDSVNVALHLLVDLAQRNVKKMATKREFRESFEDAKNATFEQYDSALRRLADAG